MSELSDFFSRPVGIMNWVYSWDPAECAERALKDGFDCIQWGIIDPDLSKAKEAAHVFSSEGLDVVGIAAYQNIVATDPDIKQKSETTIRCFIELSGYFPQSRGVVTETGTKHPTDPWGFDPLNLESAAWQEMLDVLKPLGELARAANTKILLEGYIENILRHADDIQRLRATLDPEIFGYIMDPYNLLEESELADQPGALDKVFTAMRGLAPLAHAKDVLYEKGKISTPRSGTGVFDFPAYFKRLDEQMPGVPLILEHLEADEVPETLDFLKSQYETYLKTLD